jgi:hypothetical protein
MENEIREKKSNLRLASFCVVQVGHVAQQAASWQLAAAMFSARTGSRFLDGPAYCFSPGACLHGSLAGRIRFFSTLILLVAVGILRFSK